MKEYIPLALENANLIKMVCECSCKLNLQLQLQGKIALFPQSNTPSRKEALQVAGSQLEVQWVYKDA